MAASSFPCVSSSQKIVCMNWNAQHKFEINPHSKVWNIIPANHLEKFIKETGNKIENMSNSLPRPIDDATPSANHQSPNRR